MAAKPSTGTATPASSSSSSSLWTYLEFDLADLVLQRLPSHTDRVRFAAVCRHWRYAAREHSPPALPWISFRTGAIESLTLSRNDQGVRHFFRFRERRLAACSGSFGDWQLFEEASRRRPSRRYHYLRKTLSGAILRLPGRCEKPVRANPDGSSHGVMPFVTWRSSSSAFEIRKVMVCSDDLIAAIVSYCHFSVMPILVSVVVCCRPGMSTWSGGLYYNADHCYMDMAFYNGKIYAVTREGHLFAHEFAESSSVTKCNKPRVHRIKEVIAAPPPAADGVFAASFSDMACYLVTSHTGKLLMVRWAIRYRNERVMLKVFEADLETSQWVELKRLDGEMLFVSPYCSKAIRTSSHGGCLEGNRVYLIDGSLVRSDLRENYKVACVYYMRGKWMEPIALGKDITSVHDVGWLFP